jgi:hypothetical protein
MPECEAFTEVHIVRTAEDFSAALDKARAEEADPEFRGKLRNLGRDNSWSTRVQVVLDHIGAK